MSSCDYECRMSAPSAAEAAEAVDYYAVLELTKGAQDAEVKKA